MVFNPLFFNSSTGFESDILTKPTPSSVNKFLFSDIIKVLVDESPGEILSKSNTPGSKTSGVSLINSLVTQLKSDSASAQADTSSLKITDLVAMLIDGYIPQSENQQSNTGNLEMTLASKDLQQLLSGVLESTKATGEITIKTKDKNGNIVQNDLLNIDDLKSLIDSGQSIILTFTGSNAPFELTIDSATKDAASPAGNSENFINTMPAVDGKFFTVKNETDDYKVTLELKSTGNNTAVFDNTLNYNFEQLTQNDSGISNSNGMFTQSVLPGQFLDQAIRNYKFEELGADANLKDLVAKIGMFGSSNQSVSNGAAQTGFASGIPLDAELLASDKTTITPGLELNNAVTGMPEGATKPELISSDNKIQQAVKSQAEGNLQQTSGKEVNSTKTEIPKDIKTTSANIQGDVKLPEELKQYAGDITAIKYVKTSGIPVDNETVVSNNKSPEKNIAVSTPEEEETKTTTSANIAKQSGDSGPVADKSIKESVASFKQNITNVKEGNVLPGSEKTPTETQINNNTDVKPAVTNETGNVKVDNKTEVKPNQTEPTKTASTDGKEISSGNQSAKTETVIGDSKILNTPNANKAEEKTKTISAQKNTTVKSTVIDESKSSNLTADEKPIEDTTEKVVTGKETAVNSTVNDASKTEQKNSALKLKVNQQVKAAKTTVGNEALKSEKTIENKTNVPLDGDTKIQTAETTEKGSSETTVKVTQNETKVTSDVKPSTNEKAIKPESVDVKKTADDTVSKQKNTDETKAKVEKTASETTGKKVNNESTKPILETSQPEQKTQPVDTNKSTEANSKIEVNEKTAPESKIVTDSKQQTNQKENQPVKETAPESKSTTSTDVKVETKPDKFSTDTSEVKSKIEKEVVANGDTGKQVKTDVGEKEVKISEPQVKEKTITNSEAEKSNAKPEIENPDPNSLKNTKTESTESSIKTDFSKNIKEENKLSGDKIPANTEAEHQIENSVKNTTPDIPGSKIKSEIPGEIKEEIKLSDEKNLQRSKADTEDKTPVQQKTNIVNGEKQVEKVNEEKISEPVEDKPKISSEESPVKTNPAHKENVAEKVKSPISKHSNSEEVKAGEKEITSADNEEVKQTSVKEKNSNSAKVEFKYNDKEDLKTQEAHVANETKKAAGKDKNESQSQTVNVVNETVKQEIKDFSNVSSDEKLKVENAAGKESSLSNSTPENENKSNEKHSGSQQKEVSKAAEFSVKEKQPYEFTDTKQSVDRTVKTSEIMKEISRFVEKGEKNTLILQIEPENLGKVKIVLDNTDNIVRATIHVENEAVKAAIQNNLSELYSKLEKSGIQLNSLNISLGDADPKQAKYTSSGKKHTADKKKFEEGAPEDKSSVKSYGYNTYEYLV